MTVDERFNKYVERVGECLIWNGARGGWKNRFGMFFENRSKGAMLAHRYAWERKHGPIPDGVLVAQHCHNHLCCEPNHLYLTTTPRGRPSYKRAIVQVEALTCPRPNFDSTWRERALCKGEKTSQFFPDGNEEGITVESVMAAQRVCLNCPVRDHCLWFAIDTRQEFGIWGGATSEQRRSIWRKSRQRIA